jgi:hypothetical protein
MKTIRLDNALEEAKNDLLGAPLDRVIDTLAMAAKELAAAGRPHAQTVADFAKRLKPAMGDAERRRARISRPVLSR